MQERQSTDIHPSYKGTVLFRNVFDGELPATDYPKVNVCGHCVRLPCITRSAVLLRHVPLLHWIGGCLGLVVLQACYRNSPHTGKIYLSAIAPKLTPYSTISPVLLASL